MPNPNDPDQDECKRCFGSGYVVGTYNLCACVSGNYRRY